MFAYLSRWYIPATRELAQRPDFRADARWVSERLRPKISVAKATKALATLKTLGMLAIEADGTCKPVDVSVSTAHEVSGLAAHNYHRQMLERATEAIEGFDPEERHIVGATVAIPLDLVPRLKEEIGNAAQRLMHLCDEHAGDAERVYQLHMALVPLSSHPAEES